VASEIEPKISTEVWDRPIRSAAFPYDDSDPLPDRLITIARMLGVEPEQLAREEAEDDVPSFWPLPLRRGPSTKGESDMANEGAEKVIAEGWDEVNKAAASAGSWVKWEDGQTHQLNVFGKPVFFEKVFDDGPKRRVRVSVFIPAEGTVKTWEMASGTMRELTEERADCKTPFDDAVFAIKRNGMGKTTTYKMRYQRQLTAPEIAQRSDAAAANGNPNVDPFG
jgi:hypothetical protein